MGNLAGSLFIEQPSTSSEVGIQDKPLISSQIGRSLLTIGGETNLWGAVLAMIFERETVTTCFRFQFELLPLNCVPVCDLRWQEKRYID